jgi:hypothetical protein
MTEKMNRPGAPANLPQHLVGDYGDKPARKPAKRPKTGAPKTAPSDPHPSQEEGYGRKSKIPMTGL